MLSSYLGFVIFLVAFFRKITVRKVAFKLFLMGFQGGFDLNVGFDFGAVTHVVIANTIRGSADEIAFGVV